MAMITAILRLAVCFSGIMNTAGVCGTSVGYITSQLFSLLHQSTANQCNCPKEIKFKAKEDFRCINSDSIVKQSQPMEIFLHFLHFQENGHLNLVPFLRRCGAWLQASVSRPGLAARCQAGKQTALVQFPALVLLSLQNLSSVDAVSWLRPSTLTRH